MANHHSVNLLLACLFTALTGATSLSMSPEPQPIEGPRKPTQAVPGDIIELPSGACLELPGGAGTFTSIRGGGRIEVGQRGAFKMVAGPNGATISGMLLGTIHYPANSVSEVQSPLGGGVVQVPGKPAIHLPSNGAARP